MTRRPFLNAIRSGSRSGRNQPSSAASTTGAPHAEQNLGLKGTAPPALLGRDGDVVDQPDRPESGRDQGAGAGADPIERLERLGVDDRGVIDR